MFGNYPEEQQGWGFTRQDLGPGLITAGLSMLANNDGRMGVAQLVGQGGLDAMEGIMARKKADAALRRQNELDERARQQHELTMKQGNAQLADTERLNALKARFAAGDRSPEVLYGLYGDKMVAHELKMREEAAKRAAEEQAAKKKREERAALLQSWGIMPGTVSAMPETGGEQPSQPVKTDAPQNDATPANPFAGFNMEAVARAAALPGEEGDMARQILKSAGDYEASTAKAAKGRMEVQRAEDKKKAAEEKAQADAARGLEALNSVERLLNSDAETTGFWGAGLGKIPGSTAYDMREHLVTVKGLLGLDQLQQLRNASQTGGALGQVTESEHKILQSTIAALNPNMSREEFSRNLSIVKTLLSDIVNGTDTAIVRDKDGNFVGLRNGYDTAQGFSSGNRNQANDDWDSFYD